MLLIANIIIKEILKQVTINQNTTCKHSVGQLYLKLGLGPFCKPFSDVGVTLHIILQLCQSREICENFRSMLYDTFKYIKEKEIWPGESTTTKISTVYRHLIQFAKVFRNYLFSKLLFQLFLFLFIFFKNCFN